MREKDRESDLERDLREIERQKNLCLVVVAIFTLLVAIACITGILPPIETIAK